MTDLEHRADDGRLRDAPALQADVRRMLSDRKSTVLVTGFFATWLSLEQVATMKGDTTLFPEFDDDLRHAQARNGAVCREPAS